MFWTNILVTPSVGGAAAEETTEAAEEATEAAQTHTSDSPSLLEKYCFIMLQNTLYKHCSMGSETF